MEPVVHRLKQEYSDCIQFERANYHSESEWHPIVGPLAAPEFALLTESGEVIYRWFGVVEIGEFGKILNPICE